MTWTHDDRFLAPAWGISLAVHAAAVGLAIAFAAQVKPVLQEEVFQWDVSLVQAVVDESALERTEPAVKPAHPMARVTPVPPVEPMPENAAHSVAPQRSVQMVHPVIEPVKPIEQKITPPPVEPVEQKVEQPKTEPIEQKEVETAKSKVEPVVEAKPEPVQQAEPMVAESQPVAVAASAESNETRPLHHEPVAQASAAVPSPDAPAFHTAPAPSSHHESHEASAHRGTDAALPATTAPVQIAKATAPGSEAKVDHRWLAESLWRRVAELKRYPSAARLNGLEGKVVLKAVIRSDGHLAEVSVQKSSGHTVLDAAAMEAVKLACPLHMKHAIGKPEIVVSLPIVYSLAN